MKERKLGGASCTVEIVDTGLTPDGRYLIVVQVDDDQSRRLLVSQAPITTNQERTRFLLGGGSRAQLVCIAEMLRGLRRGVLSVDQNLGRNLSRPEANFRYQSTGTISRALK